MVRDRLDLTAGLRFDHERKDASLNTFFDPPIAPPTRVEAEPPSRTSRRSSRPPTGSSPTAMTYVSLARGFKAGGFNPVSPAGSEGYGEEYTWHVEGGVKSLWAAGRVSTSVALFHIDWDDLQLNLPVTAVAGAVLHRERRRRHQPRPRDGTAGAPARGGGRVRRLRLHARAVLDGQHVGRPRRLDNRIPNTPEYTATVGGAALALVRPGITAYGRAETVLYGAFAYDEANLAEQEAYSVANFRAGAPRPAAVRRGWVRNAFDTKYVPVAFAYRGSRRRVSSARADVPARSASRSG
jgi:iron complex outermembrane recepter protein